MPLTEWDPSYNLGIKEIDEHHQKLVELLNKTYDIILYATEKRDIEQILKELIDYTNYHFAAEERLMKENKCSGYRAHVNRHNEFKQQLNALYAGYHSGEAFVSTDVVLFLREWLLNHILKADIKIVSQVLPPHTSISGNSSSFSGSGTRSDSP